MASDSSMVRLPWFAMICHYGLWPFRRLFRTFGCWKTLANDTLRRPLLLHFIYSNWTLIVYTWQWLSRGLSPDPLTRQLLEMFQHDPPNCMLESSHMVVLGRRVGCAVATATSTCGRTEVGVGSTVGHAGIHQRPSLCWKVHKQAQLPAIYRNMHNDTLPLHN